ncbi:hypothetical protein [Bacillus sp. Brlt_9]|uniref:hypothetical protein n=1 Tax=Bacillus sp. Brlt_9 TaxID=3110916 RepID=UPI003F7BB5FC
MFKIFKSNIILLPLFIICAFFSFKLVDALTTFDELKGEYELNEAANSAGPLKLINIKNGVATFIVGSNSNKPFSLVQGEEINLDYEYYNKGEIKIQKIEDDSVIFKTDLEPKKDIFYYLIIAAISFSFFYLMLHIYEFIWSHCKTKKKTKKEISK